MADQLAEAGVAHEQGHVEPEQSIVAGGGSVPPARSDVVAPGSVPGRPDAAVTLETGQDGCARLFLWLDLKTAAMFKRSHGEQLWIDAVHGEPAWWRFDFRAVLLNRACFELAEVRLARDPAQRPSIAPLFCSGRRSPASGEST